MMTTLCSSEFSRPSSFLGSILEAKDLFSASYAWKSILKGREVILKRALWRVGDGKKIRIMGDNWLPSKSSAKITTSVLFG